MQNPRSKHIDIRYHYIREVVANGKVALFFIEGSENPADLFTKNLGHIKFEKFREELGLEFYSYKANMDEYAREHKLTSEEAGREIRYGFFRRILKETNARKIAVAHNKDDQAETLLMRFMRGTGIDGLKGMEFKARDIIRPILGVERSKIEKYCEDKNIDIIILIILIQHISIRNYKYFISKTKDKIRKRYIIQIAVYIVKSRLYNINTGKIPV